MALFQNTIHYITGRQQGRQDQGSHSVYFQDEESTGSVLDLLTGYSELIWAHLQKKPVFTPGSHPSAALYPVWCKRLRWGDCSTCTAPHGSHQRCHQQEYLMELWHWGHLVLCPWGQTEDYTHISPLRNGDEVKWTLRLRVCQNFGLVSRQSWSEVAIGPCALQSLCEAQQNDADGLGVVTVPFLLSIWHSSEYFVLILAFWHLGRGIKQNKRIVRMEL